MFARKQFVPTTPRYTPPAPMNVAEVQATLEKLELKRHPIDTPAHKIPLGEHSNKTSDLIYFFLGVDPITPSEWWKQYLKQASETNDKQCDSFEAASRDT